MTAAVPPTVPPTVRSQAPGELEPAVHRPSLLASDHPFLRIGTWRRFSVGDPDPPGGPGLVASLDPRQRIGSEAVGAIGFIDPPGDLRDPALSVGLRAAVEAAEQWLGAGGAGRIRCPVQFSTWFGHRTMIDGFPSAGGPPSFPMEPTGGPGVAEILIGSGFRIAHTAGSYLVDVDRWIEATHVGEERMRAAGFRDRGIRPDRLGEELAALHAIASVAFRGSWGFSEIGLPEFVSLYGPLAGRVEPDFVRILETPGGEPVGFMFAYPDPATDPGRPGARFVAKSLAVLPEVARRMPGIGMGLALTVYRWALERGYARAIHACVADGAYTQRASARRGERFRSYATFEKVVR